MITKDSIETAYSFLHQKQRIYVHSTLEWQRDDIEMAIAAYADDMNPHLFEIIAHGTADFLHDHSRFVYSNPKVYHIVIEKCTTSQSLAKLVLIQQTTK